MSAPGRKLPFISAVFCQSERPLSGKADGDIDSPRESSEEIEIRLDADCYALAMISMGTIEELHSHNHTLALYCISCDRWGEANLEWLIQIGRGDKPVTEARFRCRDCGEIVEKQVRPPVPSLGSTVAYVSVA